MHIYIYNKNKNKIETEMDTQGNIFFPFSVFVLTLTVFSYLKDSLFLHYQSS